MNPHLQLFVAGDSPRGQRAVANVRHLHAVLGSAEDELEIVDVLERPDLAEENGILATPTVISISPHSTRRVIGDMSDMVRLADALDIVLPLPRQDDAC